MFPAPPQAVSLFSANRPPGIYKEEYVQALFDHYHEKRPSTTLCPPVPDWKRGGEEDEEEGEAAAVIDPKVSLLLYCLFLFFSFSLSLFFNVFRLSVW